MDHALAGLDPEQAEVVRALEGPVLVHAGAGTGKTRAVTHRLVHACLTGARDPRRALAVTFTTRAAGELRDRVAKLGVPGITARTIHAAALSQVRHFWPVVVAGAFPQLIAAKTPLVARVAADLGMPGGAAVVRDLVAEVDWAGANLLLPGDYAEQAAAAGRAMPGPSGERLAIGDVASLLGAYHAAKERDHIIDLDDVLLDLIAMMGERPDVADEIRAAYRWFTVDEYQDVTPLQERLIWAWLGERDDICVVGDPNQTIYTFAGASPRSMDRFTQRWPHARKVVLDRCYRCTPQIVASANALTRAAGRGSASGVTLRSTQADGPQPQVIMCPDDTQQAHTLATRIAALVAAGTSVREIAILTRTNAGTEPIELALREAGIPYATSGSERFFSRDEVREATARLRGAARSQSASGQLPATGLRAATEEVFAGMQWSPAGPLEGASGRRRWESLAALVALAGEVAETSGAWLGDLVAEIERRAQLSLAPVAEAVTLTTLHAAKGLEWDAVLIPGCVEGNIPSVHATTPDQLEEERRLLYVGMTRARVVLMLSWAVCREPDGRQRLPSRFLAQLRASRPLDAGRAAPSMAASSGPGPAAAGRGAVERTSPGRCRMCGQALVTAPERTIGRCRRCPGEADQVTLAALQQWRSQAATAARVPEGMILTEVTMAALAELRPTDSAGLAAIPGVGPAKVKRFGAEILAVIGDCSTGAPAGPGDRASGAGNVIRLG